MYPTLLQQKCYTSCPELSLHNIQGKQLFALHDQIHQATSERFTVLSSLFVSVDSAGFVKMCLFKDRGYNYGVFCTFAFIL